jgi:hypothetical protein
MFQSLSFGGVAERLKAAVLKTVRPERVSWVRIPPPPPTDLRSSPETWVTERTGDIGYTFGPKGLLRGCRVFSLQVDVAEIVLHKDGVLQKVTEVESGHPHPDEIQKSGPVPGDRKCRTSRIRTSDCGLLHSFLIQRHPDGDVHTHFFQGGDFTLRFDSSRGDDRVRRRAAQAAEPFEICAGHRAFAVHVGAQKSGAEGFELRHNIFRLKG